MWILLVKFVIAGSLVISVEYLASHARADLAGLIAIMPALTLASYILVSIQGGSPLLQKVSMSSLIALPATAAYLLAVFLGSKYGWSPWIILPGGVVIFFICGILLINLRC